MEDAAKKEKLTRESEDSLISLYNH